MKLIIQIPCYNEEKTLPITLRDLPKRIDGVDEIEILVIDDGSTDKTSLVARELGVHHIVRLTQNQGLARAFKVGLDACLRLGADVIVNTDGDNQYRGADIAKLVRPILEGEADIVIGARPIKDISHFSPLKKALQKAGSYMVSRLAGIEMPDVTSGFRAFSRDAALRLNVISSFTYTIETIIQAGKKNIPITWVPIRTNAPLRPSRLFRGIPDYLRRAVPSMLRIYGIYEPLKTFLILGLLLFIAGSAIGVRFLYFYFTGRGGGHIQSLILAAVLVLMGFQTGVMGLVADLIGANRRLIEDLLYYLRRGDTARRRIGGEG